MLTITDTSSGNITATATAEVNVAGISVTADPINVVVGGNFTGTVDTFTDSAPDASTDPTGYSATINWGDGNTTGNIAWDSTNSDFTVTDAGNHTYSTGGTPTLTITVTGPDSRIGNATETANVTSLTTTAQSITGVQGQSFAGVVATFSDINSGTTAGDYTATIDWGDGNDSDGTITGNDTAGFTVSGNNTFAAAGNLTVTVTICDPSGATATVTDTADVAGMIPTAQTIAATVNQNISATLVTFTDTASDASNYTAGNYTASVDWGDGLGPVAATVTGNASVGYTVSGNYTFTTIGTVNPTVTMLASDGRAVMLTSEVDVAGTPDVSIVGSSTVQEGSPYTLYLSAPELGANTITGWTINWGDGTGNQTITGNPSSAQYTYGSGVSLATVAAWATDQGGTYAADAAASVSVLPLPPTDVQAVRNNDGSVTISWSNPSTIADSFAIGVSANGGNFTTLAAGLTNDSYTASGLDPSASLEFDVAAANGSGGQGTPAQVLLPVGTDTSMPTPSILVGSWSGLNPDGSFGYGEPSIVLGSDGNLSIMDEAGEVVNATFDGTTIHVAANNFGWPNGTVSGDYNTITWQGGSSQAVVWTKFSPTVQVASLTVTDTNTGVSGNTTSPENIPTLNVTADANGNMDLSISATVSPAYAVCPNLRYLVYQTIDGNQTVKATGSLASGSANVTLPAGQYTIEAGFSSGSGTNADVVFPQGQNMTVLDVTAQPPLKSGSLEAEVLPQGVHEFQSTETIVWRGGLVGMNMRDLEISASGLAAPEWKGNVLTVNAGDTINVHTMQDFPIEGSGMLTSLLAWDSSTTSSPAKKLLTLQQPIANKPGYKEEVSVYFVDSAFEFDTKPPVDINLALNDVREKAAKLGDTATINSIINIPIPGLNLKKNQGWFGFYVFVYADGRVSDYPAGHGPLWSGDGDISRKTPVIIGWASEPIPATTQP